MGESRPGAQVAGRTLHSGAMAPTGDTVTATATGTATATVTGTGTGSPASRLQSNLRRSASAMSVAASRGAARLLSSPGELTNEQLATIERRRRAVLLRNELPFWKILTFWDGTCLKLMALDPLFWVTVVVYAVVRAASRTGLPDSVQDLGSGNIGVLGSFLSFFLVFFVVSSNKRFDDQYGMSMAAKGTILDVASLCRGQLPRARALRINRYLNASHVVAYCGLSDVYSSGNLFAPMNEGARLLTPEEWGRIQNLDMDAGGSCYRELIAWAQLEVTEAQGAGHLDGPNSGALRQRLLALQGALSGLYNFADQPIAFFYVHFISLLSALYLPLFAASSAFEAGTGQEVYWTSDLVNGLIVMLQAIFVIGLRLLGQKLSDPYGSDEEDLSVMHYLNFTWTQSNRILAAEAPGGNRTDEVEDDIVRERVTIGAAWDGEEEKAPRAFAGGLQHAQKSEEGTAGCAVQ